MSTAPTLYLEFENSKRRLDLTSDRYRIGSRFQPPTVVSNLTLASGTSANDVGRTRVTSRSPQPTSFSFLEQVWGDSSREVDRALADLQSVLAWAGDDLDPLFLVYKSNSDTPEPMLGQDGRVRYKVMKGEVSPGSDYSSRPSRESVVRDCEISLLLQPYAFGRRQILASAKGQISLIRSGSVGSEIVGVAAPYNAVNQFHNPVFAHKTWSNKWTAAAGVVGFVNTDKRFVMTGERSLYLVAQPTGSRVWYQALTLTAATYCISFKVKRRDGGVVDSSICQAYYNSVLQTSTYRALGDGWYLVFYAGTASASATNYGIGLSAGVSVYVDDFQVEGLGFPTQIAHADSLGCSPNVGYHDSAVLRTLGYIKYPAARAHRLLGTGTISAIVTTPQASYGSNFVVFYESSTGFRLYYSIGTTSWVVSDNTNSASYSDALSVGKRTHLHATWGKSGLALYVNGVQRATSGTYTPGAAIGDMYLLTDPTPTFHQDHYLSEYVVWGEELTSTQIANDYATKLTLAGQATSIPPIFWTKDGDDILDNANDSTRDNFGVALCVPGSAPALTRYSVAGLTDGETYTLGNWELPEFISPERVLYYEQSGSADATCSGGQYKRVSIGTTELSLSSDYSKWEFSSGDSQLLRFVKGRRFSGVARMKNAGVGYLRWRHLLSGLHIQQPLRVATIGDYWRNYILPAIVIPETDSEIYQIGDTLDTLAVNGSAANVDIDYFFLMPHPSFSFFAGGAAVIEGREYDGYYGVSAQSVSGVITGGEINLRPTVYNVILMSAYGTMAVLDNNSIDTTLTFSKIEVAPRWELLQ